ncbi:hypothetical protein ACSRUE_20510 [Sorangium sp. KYC3313]|uniref:hypothetical protein n=1 Tax=Sorangium sp. KYC3313 TaxID=3449740 RepID=UPI003F88826B
MSPAVTGAVAVSAALAAVAARAVREGCAGETLAAVLAAEQLGHAQDPAARGPRRAVRARRSAEKFTVHLDPEERLPTCGEFC